MSEEKKQSEEVRKNALAVTAVMIMVCPVLLGAALDIGSWALGVPAGLWSFASIVYLGTHRDV